MHVTYTVCTTACLSTTLSKCGVSTIPLRELETRVFAPWLHPLFWSCMERLQSKHVHASVARALRGAVSNTRLYGSLWPGYPCWYSLDTARQFPLQTANSARACKGTCAVVTGPAMLSLVSVLQFPTSAIFQHGASLKSSALIQGTSTSRNRVCEIETKFKNKITCSSMWLELWNHPVYCYRIVISLSMDCRLQYFPATLSDDSFATACYWGRRQ